MTILLIHIGIALTSLVLSSLNFARPTFVRLRASYALMAGTFISGTYLVLQDTSHLATACVSGLAYFSAVGVLTALSKQKLAQQS